MAVRLPQELIERIDEWMKAGDARSRSDAIRRLIELGLGRSAVKTRQTKAAVSRVHSGPEQRSGQPAIVRRG
jgi:Arc/MetJ-type ribon-helix-helix transcriptional regulator